MEQINGCVDLFGFILNDMFLPENFICELFKKCSYVTKLWVE